MTEDELRELIESVRRGRTSRRAFISALMGMGVAAPLASQLLLHSGIAEAQISSDYKPTRRGGGGPLKVLWWQGPTLLNPHFATGSKDVDGSRVFYEPLASWNGDGGLVPTLAAEIPTLANGGLSRDGRSVTWKFVRFRSANNKFEFSIDRASQLLDKAGWKKGSDGMRMKDGKKLKFVFQTSVNQPRQKAQSISKQACQKSGIEMELKSVVASVYFSSDMANPDTNRKFYSDIQMYSVSMTRPDPGLAMNSFLSREIASKANKWLNLNVTRWRSAEYDKTHRAAELELDPVKRAALLIRLNDLVVQNHVVVPIVARAQTSASSSKLRMAQSGWDSDFWAMQDWYRET